ncbi:MAG: T9SS type A sorting domain-containing protein [Ignavibacteria bacterium]|nr:T9SS type A sorting domain-containing protein [Ignavibacteria bacterium]
MNKIIIVPIIVLFCISQKIYPQGSWYMLSPLTDHLTSVFFVDSLTGFTCTSSNESAIWKTINGGANWTTKSSQGSTHFNSIKFSSNNTGWAALGGGAFGKVLKTTDAGETWNQSFAELRDFYDCDFLNDLTGFVCGSRNASILYFPYIRRTTNGGDSWVNVFEPNSGESKLRSISILNNNIVIAVGDAGYIFRSSNLGENWVNVSPGPNVNFTKIFYLKSLINNQTCWAVNNTSIYISTNLGANWVIKSNIQNLQSIEFLNQQTGWAIGRLGVMYYTTNEGLNWISYNSNVSTDLLSIYFVSPNLGWVVGKNGKILKNSTGSIPIGINTISSEAPTQFSLSQNYPNPFNPATKIKFQIPQTGSAAETFLSVYDILGRQVAVLVNQQLQPGTYEVDWDASAFMSGVYFYVITLGSFKETRKMVLIK